MDQNRPLSAKMGHLGPFQSRECQNRVRNKLILTNIVVLTMLGHFGPAQLPAVARSLLTRGSPAHSFLLQPSPGKTDMSRCPRCRPQSREAWTKNEWTDNDRLPMKWEIISSNALPSLSTLTPRELLQKAFGAKVLFR